MRHLIWNFVTLLVFDSSGPMFCVWPIYFLLRTHLCEERYFLPAIDSRGRCCGFMVSMRRGNIEDLVMELCRGFVIKFDSDPMRLCTDRENARL